MSFGVVAHALFRAFPGMAANVLSGHYRRGISNFQYSYVSVAGRQL
jgi:hypothetical protein